MQFADVRLPERFWSKVITEPNSGCWIWTANLRRGGYGGFYGGRGRSRRAHKIAYEALVGAVPDGLELDHLCRTRCCVNPRHMEAVTRTVNVRRGVAPAARFAIATHCKNGHPFDEQNTHRWRGRRFCKACMKKHSDAWKAAHPQELKQRYRRQYLAKKEAA